MHYNPIQIPETPERVEHLDLMKRLDDYANGQATWTGSPIGPNTKQECSLLHSHLVQLVDDVFAPILTRTTSRELETFTMHDPKHGLKVAHLMWHILEPGRRQHLTPPEIAMLVVAAHLHDLGMALMPEERRARLAPDSDLWDRLEVDDATKHSIEQFRARIADLDLPEPAKLRAGQQ
ncbi:MAG: HD domain-containing protein, partial [bacterium]